jgi:hypothetical protein
LRAFQLSSAVRIRLGVNTAMRAIALLEGIDKLGPPYLMAREMAAERRTNLIINTMLLFIVGKKRDRV